MNKNLVSLTNSKAHSVRAGMGSHCLIQYSYRGFRFLRYKCSPWLTLAIAPFKLLCSSGNQRTHENIRYLTAISKLDFVCVYGLLNDLLW